jgi:hypothetical protein
MRAALSRHAVKPRQLIPRLFSIPCRERGCLPQNFGRIGYARLASMGLIPYTQAIAMHRRHGHLLSVITPADTVAGGSGQLRA